MNVAYSNKILKFPTNILRKLLLYNREDDLLTDCRYYNVGCDEKCVYFEKGKFNLQNKVVSFIFYCLLIFFLGTRLLLF